MARLCMTMPRHSRQELLRLLVDEATYHDDGIVTVRTLLPLEQLHPVSRG